MSDHRRKQQSEYSRMVTYYQYMLLMALIPRQKVSGVLPLIVWVDQ